MNAVVKQLQNDIQYTEEQLKEKQREEEELNKQISDLINKTDSIGKYGGGTMFWPVPAVHNISSGFGYRWGRLHKGIDISRERFPFTDKMNRGGGRRGGHLCQQDQFLGRRIRLLHHR